MEFTDLTNIADIWESLFFPLLDTICVFLFCYVLIGKERILQYCAENWAIRDGIILRRKKLRRSGYFAKDAPSLYLPVNNTFIKALQKFPVQLFILVIAVYSCHKFIFFVSRFYPVHYGYSITHIVLNSVQSPVLIEIWSHFPDYTFDTLCSKITSSSSHIHSALLINLSCVAEFCSVLSFISMFITFKGHQKKCILRSFFLLFLTLSVVFTSYVMEFKDVMHQIEQSAYQISDELNYNEPQQFDTLQMAQIKFEQEQEKPYYQNKTGFSLYILGKGFDF